MLRSESQEDSQGRLSESGGGALQLGSWQQQPVGPTLRGQALYRLPGLASALFKEWQPGFWVLKSEKLLLFESKADYEHSKEPGSAASLLKKQVLLSEGLVVGQLKYKDYPKFGALHHFTVDNRRDGATSTVLKFASHDRSALAFLRDALQTRLAESVKRRLDYAARVVGPAGSRETIISKVVMKERTRNVAAAAASPSLQQREAAALGEGEGSAV